MLMEGTHWGSHWQEGSVSHAQMWRKYITEGSRMSKSPRLLKMRQESTEQQKQHVQMYKGSTLGCRKMGHLWRQNK